VGLPAEAHALVRAERRQFFDVFHLAVGHEGLGFLGRVVLAQRVPLELRIQQDASQVGVPHELDAEHVVRLALGPVGRAPQLGERLDFGVVALGITDRRLQAEPVSLAEGVQVRDDVEARLAVEPVDAGQIDEHFHAGLGGVAQEARHFLPMRGIDDDRVVSVLRVGLEDDPRKLLSNEID